MPLPPDPSALLSWGFAFAGPLRDELTRLALDGTKTTTAGLWVELEIDGEALWDGGFSLNPPIQALAADGRDCDILIVRLSPSLRTDVPRTRHEVAERATELAFAAPLQAELEALAAADRAAQPARLGEAASVRNLYDHCHAA